MVFETNETVDLTGGGSIPAGIRSFIRSIGSALPRRTRIPRHRHDWPDRNRGRTKWQGRIPNALLSVLARALRSDVSSGCAGALGVWRTACTVYWMWSFAKDLARVRTGDGPQNMAIAYRALNLCCVPPHATPLLCSLDHRSPPIRSTVRAALSSSALAVTTSTSRTEHEASPRPGIGKSSISWIGGRGMVMRRPSYLPSLSFNPFSGTVRAFSHRRGLLLTSASRSGGPATASVRRHCLRTRRRSPGVNPASFPAYSPDLQSRPLMDMDFATSCPLVQPLLPRIRLLFVRSWVRSTYPSDGPSRFRPCASLVLHLHQAPGRWAYPAHMTLRAAFGGDLQPVLSQAAHDGGEEIDRDRETPLDRIEKHRHDRRGGNPGLYF